MLRFLLWSCHRAIDRRVDSGVDLYLVRLCQRGGSGVPPRTTLAERTPGRTHLAPSSSPSSPSSSPSSLGFLCHLPVTLPAPARSYSRTCPTSRSPSSPYICRTLPKCSASQQHLAINMFSLPILCKSVRLCAKGIYCIILPHTIGSCPGYYNKAEPWSLHCRGPSDIKL